MISTYARIYDCPKFGIDYRHSMPDKYIDSMPYLLCYKHGINQCQLSSLN